MDYLTYEYERQLELHNQKIKYHKVDVLISSTLGVLENIIKLNIRKLGEETVAIKKKKVDLLLEARNLKGVEIAYVINTMKEFDNSRNRNIKNSL